MPGCRLAACALVGAALLASPSAAQTMSTELFGGLRFADELGYDGTMFDTEGGSIVGLRGLYHFTPNLAFGVEVNATNAGYVGFLSSINSRAIMAIARYTVPVTNTVDIYGTIGLGSIRVEYDGASDFPAFTGTDQVWGGQIALGAAFALSPNIGVFGELIHQAAFEDASIVSTAVEYRSTNVAVGLRFRF